MYCLAIDNMKQKVNDLISIGFIKEDILKMTFTIINAIQLRMRQNHRMQYPSGGVKPVRKREE